MTRETAPLLNESDTAALLKLRVGTLRRWRWSGFGPEWIKLGGAVRYDPEKITEFIDSGRRDPAAVPRTL